ncbi:MAG: methionyl-tRNA formyltransferase [Lachnospiraceae bacterium]|nr:methionyl-tRNA formyltransferase [Lachnospiraceae bacterium]
MRVVFMGTPDFAVPTLEALIDSRHEVAAVYTQPDREQGRGRKLVFSPVKECALRHGIPVRQPKGLKKPETVERLKSYNPDVIVVVAYGVILRPPVLESAPYGCLNVHASLLPKYRGAAPIQWAVLNGETESGVTIMQMDEGLDTGDILAAERMTLSADETGASLFDKLSVLGGPLLLKVLDDAEAGLLHPVKQGESPTMYARMLEKEDGKLDFTKDAATLERFVRGLNSWPGAYTFRDGKMLKIWKAEVAGEEYANTLTEGESLTADVSTEIGKAAPGTVISVDKNTFTVACGSSALRILELQPAGKGRMDTGAYLRGNRMEAGEVLGEEML